MTNDTTLLLTADELQLFNKLPAELREGWTAQEETIDAYEDDKTLQVRARMAEFDKHPKIQEFVKTLSEGEQDFTKLPWNELDTPIVLELFFTIGARGMSTFIDVLLADASSDEEVKYIALLTGLRHDILEANASISYV